VSNVIPIDPIAAVFGAQGILSRAFPGYAPREGQVSFARACHDTLSNGGALLCDAPCGTGKSLAYLVPAILRAVQRNERVIVATANIALQEQLVQKDLPSLKTTLAPIAGDDWRFALLKGRSNYVCLSLVNDPAQREEWSTSLSDSEFSDLRRVDAWAQRTDTGDRSEMPFTVTDNVWRMRSMDRDDCHGKSCEHYDECFARKAHERASNAAVVVVNYHLLFAHIAMRAETGRNVILPEFHALVMDEAHEAGDIAREFFGHTLSEGRVKRIERWAREARRKALAAGVECDDADARELTSAADGLHKAGDAFFNVCAEIMREVNAQRTDNKVTTLRSDAKACAPALTAMAELMEPLQVARRVGMRLHARVKRMERDGLSVTRHALRVQRDAERSARACIKALSWIEDALRPRGDSSNTDGALSDNDTNTIDAIHWINVSTSRTGKVRHTWESRHIDLSSVLYAHVWQATRAVIACSATMTTGQGNGGWTWVKRQLGAPNGARVLSVPSPFDFARQALLCLPAGDHDPKADREGFDRFVIDALKQVASAAGGRTLGLFTSARMARTAWEKLLASHGHAFNVLCQGDLPRSQLVQEFKRDETSVLCGTASLWTGVDVQGHACVCVLIDKLPFAPPGDPVMDALCERAVARTGKTFAGFMEESLPRAVLALRQGVGRLIRSVDDWGCVVICDPRLTSKGYGGDIVRALALPTRTRSIAEACAWLERGVREMKSERNGAVNE
jgi:ATP-dependent DNA helicase DinG